MFETVLDRTKIEVTREDSTTTVMIIEVLYKLGNLVDKNLVAFIFII